MLKITALMDNKISGHRALIAEHGLSYYIEGPSFRFLFDCGSGPHVQDNAHKLGRGLEGLSAVILSHSHYDHAAGYRDLIENGKGSPILYTGPRFFEPKYAKKGVKYCDLSCGFGREFLEEHGIDHRVITRHTAIAPGVYLVGSFPRRNSFEQIPARFVRQTAEGLVPDDFPDEICMAVDVGGKLVVLVGCSHPGILNMVEHVSRVLQMPVCAVFGGTHLMEADEARIEKTVTRLKELGLEIIGFSHCSGDLAEEILQRDDSLCACHMGVGDCMFF